MADCATNHFGPGRVTMSPSSSAAGGNGATSSGSAGTTGRFGHWVSTSSSSSSTTKEDSSLHDGDEGRSFSFVPHHNVSSTYIPTLRRDELEYVGACARVVFESKTFFSHNKFWVWDRHVRVWLQAKLEDHFDGDGFMENIKLLQLTVQEAMRWKRLSATKKLRQRYIGEVVGVVPIAPCCLLLAPKR